MIDLKLSRKNTQECHIVLEENLDDTGAYSEQTPQKSLHLVGSSEWSCKSLSLHDNKSYRRPLSSRLENKETVVVSRISNQWIC